MGPVVAREEGILAGVFSGYSLLEPTANASEVGQVLNALNQKRKTLGLAPATLAESQQPAAAKAARGIEQNGKTPQVALGNLLEDVSHGGQVKGWYMDAGEIQALPFPDELVRRPTLKLAIGVAHYKPEGSPWGAYAVLAVMSDAVSLLLPAPRRIQVATRQ